MDSSSCDSAWNTFGVQSDDELKTTTSTESSKPLAKKSKNSNLIKKTAIKTSITVPLVTPSTQIVPLTSSDPADVNKDFFIDDPPKETKKRSQVKKAKMCTVCGQLCALQGSLGN